MPHSHGRISPQTEAALRQQVRNQAAAILETLAGSFPDGDTYSALQMAAGRMVRDLGLLSINAQQSRPSTPTPGATVLVFGRRG